MHQAYAAQALAAGSLAYKLRISHKKRQWGQKSAYKTDFVAFEAPECVSNSFVVPLTSC